MLRAPPRPERQHHEPERGPLAPFLFACIVMDMKMGFLNALKKAWNGIQVDDQSDRKTRFIMTVWAFILLSNIMIACFVAAVAGAVPEVSLAWIDLIKHLSYVFGGVISAFFAVESFFPSEPRPWGNGWNGGGWYGSQKEVEVDPKKEPPAHPSESDAQVD